MNELMNLTFQGRKVRMVMRGGDPWWVARDVCEVLEIANYRDAVSRLDEDEKDAVGLTDAIGRTQEGAIINEAGLYSLVLSSRKPEAREFKRWITHEVLPSIRRNGMYATEALLDDPEHLLRVTARLVEERRARLAAEAEVQRLAPKAEFHDRVSSSRDAMSIREAAKLLGTGQNRMFQWLRGQRILMADNLPYQEYIDAGYFRVIEQTWTDSAGERHLSHKTLVTGRGLTWLQKRWDADHPQVALSAPAHLYQ